jgi:hypothetical protein
MHLPARLIPWVRGAALGILLGTVVLGIGGRASMRGIAISQGTPAGFSPGGSGTVVFLGAASGLAAGLLYAAARTLLPGRPWLGRLAFAVVLLAIVLRGLRPIDADRLLWFVPLFVVFGVAIDRLWERPYRPPVGQSDGV